MTSPGITKFSTYKICHLCYNCTYCCLGRSLRIFICASTCVSRVAPFTLCMSPAHGSPAIRQLKHSNAVEIHDGITFDFYTGLPHMQESHVKIMLLISNTSPCSNRWIAELPLRASGTHSHFVDTWICPYKTCMHLSLDGNAALHSKYIME